MCDKAHINTNNFWLKHFLNEKKLILSKNISSQAVHFVNPVSDFYSLRNR